MSARDDFITNQINQAKAAGLSPEDADNQITSAVSNFDKQQNRGMFTGALEDLGKTNRLQNLPIIGPISSGANALAQGMLQPLAKEGDLVGEDINRIVNLPKTGMSLKGYKPKFMSPNDYAELTGSPGDAVKNVAGTGVQAGLAGAGIDALPGMAAGTAQAVKNAPKLLTQGTINKAMQLAKDASVAKGDTANWQDIVNNVTQALSKGPTRFRPDLQKEVQSILTNRIPATMTTDTASAGTPDIFKIGQNPNANDLHEFRIALDQGIPKSAWNHPNARPIGVEANQFVRQHISDALHTLAPETELLDKVNHIYYNPLIRGGKLPIIGEHTYPEGLTGVPSTLINAAVAGEVGKKFLGD